MIDQEAEAGLELMLDLDAALTEIDASQMTDDTKFLLRWIIDGLLLGGDPLLGLLPKPAIRKGVTQFNKLGISFGYHLRRRKGMRQKQAIYELMKLSGKKRSTILAAIKSVNERRGGRSQI